MAMDFTPDFMVLFGGAILLLTLKRKRRSRKRVRGMVAISALLIELLILLVGLSTFLYGLVHLMP